MVTQVLVVGSGEAAVPLTAAGLDCITAWDGPTALRLAAESSPSIILCDARLRGSEPLAWIEPLLAANPETPILVLDDAREISVAIDAFRRGAYDYLLLPVAETELVGRCLRALAHPGRRTSSPEDDLPSTPPDDLLHGMIGGSAPMLSVYKMIESVAGTRSNVLVTGESGTGKELVARAVHRASQVSKGPFVALNCAAIGPTLLESELFGHVKGSFTGATTNRQGFFEAAHGGTLFLDEISELPLALQPKLLRAIQERVVVRVGGTQAIPVDVRLVAASNRDLRREVAEKRFREDLFYRLCVVNIHVPALRERSEDTPALVEQAIEKSNRETGKTCKGADRETMGRLMRYLWPGNVRELQNVIERAVIVCHGERLEVGDLPDELREAQAAIVRTENLRLAVQSFERDHIRLVLTEAGGNRQMAAERLGVNPSTLYRKMAELGIRDETRTPRRTELLKIVDAE